MTLLTSDQASELRRQAESAVRDIEKRAQADYRAISAMLQTRCMHDNTLTMDDETSYPGKKFCRGCFADIEATA